MFVHKFKAGDVELFAFSNSMARPSFDKGITASSWQGKANITNANVVNGIDQIKAASYSQEDKPEEKPEEKPVEKPAEVPQEPVAKTARVRLTRLAAITGELDKIANEIQEQEPVVATAIDMISDALEGRSSKE